LKNLSQEGVDDGKIHYVGNVMIDTLVDQLPQARKLDMPGKYGLDATPYVLVTLHRPSNVDDRDHLRALVTFLREQAEMIRVVFPVHPRTRDRLHHFRLFDTLQHDRLLCLEPLGYLENLGLMEKS